MKLWTRRARGAVGMGLSWAVAWAIAGVIIGATSNLTPGLPWDSFFAVYDAPLPTLAIPGFVGGALFSLVLGIAGRRRRFDQLSLLKFAAWGAIGGLLLSLVPATAFTLGLLTGNSDVDIWKLTALISIPFTLLSALSATASLLLARRAEDRDASGRSAQALEPDGTVEQALLREGTVSLPVRTGAPSGERIPRDITQPGR
jgi:O-antigen/teichoic acid export membrane protein